MRKNLVLFALLLILCSLTSLAQTSDPATIALNRWAAALGGRERLAAVRGLHIRTSLDTGGLKGSAESWQDSQGRLREQDEIGGLKELTVFDGARGWAQDSTGKVHALAGKDLENQLTDAYLASYSQFFSGRRAGRVEYAGDEQGAWKLHIVPEGGNPATVYIDQKTGLPTKELRASEERTRTTAFEQWKDVNGVKIPALIRQTTGDPKYDISVNLVDAALNAPMESALFNKPQAGAKDFAFAGNAPSITLPLQLNNNHIFVQARVNGSQPLWFIFDSGAEATVVNGDRLRALGLKAEGKLEGRGSGGNSVDIGIIKNASIEFEGGRMTSRPVAALPLSPVEAREGREIDGVLGYDVIGSFVVEIDYAGRRLTLFDPARFSGQARGEAVPFTFDGNLPIVKAKVWPTVADAPASAPIEGHFLIDTGSRLAIELNAPFVRTHNLVASVPNAIPAVAGFGVGGASKDLVARLGQFELGSSFRHPVVFLSQDEAGSGASPNQAGTIGGGLLRRFTVTFDYGKELMYLAPNAHFNEPFEYDMSGMGLEALGPDFHQFRIIRVLDRTPASEAGILPGDKLATLNGKPMSQWTLEQIQQELRTGPGREIRMEVVRQGKTLPIVFKTRRLV